MKHQKQIKKIKAPIGDENQYGTLFLMLLDFIKKIKAPIGDENPNSPTFIKLKPIILRK